MPGKNDDYIIQHRVIRRTGRSHSFVCFELFYLRLEIAGGIKTALVPTLVFSEFPLLSPLCGHTPDLKMMTEICDSNRGRYQVTISPFSFTI